MSIQSNINQGLSIAGLLYQHSAMGEEYQETVRAKRQAGARTQAGRAKPFAADITAENVRESLAEMPEGDPKRTRMERIAEAMEVAEQVPTPRTRAAAERAQGQAWGEDYRGMEEEQAEIWVRDNTPPSSGLSRAYIKRFARMYGYTYNAATKALRKAYVERLTASARYRQLLKKEKEKLPRRTL